MITELERIKKDLITLSKFNATPEEGLTRLSFSKEDKGAREYIKCEMKKIGLEVFEDSAGTIVGRMEGTTKDAPVVMTGSHFDSVKYGGNFDGQAGVVGALEVARVIKEQHIQPKHPIEFIAMIEEEGARFSKGLFASRAMVGKITREELNINKDENDISIAQAMRKFGLNPDNIEKAKRQSETLKAFIELHIEQGPILEKTKTEIGIVDYIAGIKTINISLIGREDHAGTTPMDMRKDALVASTLLITRIEEMTRKIGNDVVATVGKIKVFPDLINVVPGRVEFVVEIRSRQDNLINQVIDEIIIEIMRISEDRNIQYEVQEGISIPPVKLSDDIIKIVNEKCQKNGFSNKIMTSGAGHDAMIMASITKSGLIFVPSKNGRSHCKEEWTDWEDLQKGVEILLSTVIELAK